MADEVSSIFAFAAEAPTSTEVAEPPADAIPENEEHAADASDGSGSEGEGIDESTDESTDQSKEGEKPKVLTLSQQQAALTKLRNESTDPDVQAVLRTAKDALGRLDAFGKLGKVEELRTLKTTVDTAGGLEGIANLQSIASSIEATDAFIDAGDPQVIDQILEDSPEGAPKLLAPFLSKIEKLNPEIYASTIQPHLVKNLVAAGLESVLSEILNAGTVEGAKAAGQKLAQWFANQKELARRNGSAEVDPREAALSKREQEFSKSETQRYHGEVGKAIKTHTDQTFGTALKPYDLSKLTGRQKFDIANSLYSAMGKAIAADKAGTLTMKSLLTKAANRDKAIAHGNDAVTRNTAAIVKQVMNEYGIKAGKVKTAAKVGTTDKTEEKKEVSANGSKIVRVSEKPDRSLWDQDKTTFDMVARGEAILKKNGVWVKWR